jgi:hypothetical protein
VSLQSKSLCLSRFLPELVKFAGILSLKIKHKQKVEKVFDENGLKYAEA